MTLKNGGIEFEHNIYQGFDISINLIVTDILNKLHSLINIFCSARCTCSTLP